MEQEEKKVAVQAVVVTKIIASEKLYDVEKESNDFIESIRRKQYSLTTVTHLVFGNTMVCIIVYQKPLNIDDELNIKKY